MKGDDQRFARSLWGDGTRVGVQVVSAVAGIFVKYCDMYAQYVG
jgi:hypothetical protein